MAGTDELREKEASTQLTLLIERVAVAQKTLHSLDENVERLASNFHQLETSQIEINGRMEARSEANRLAVEQNEKMILHVRGRTIDQDAQQVIMIREEEKERIKADEAQAQKHNDDMLALNTKLDALAQTINDLKASNRVVTVVSTFLSTIAVAVIAGGILHLFP